MDNSYVSECDLHNASIVDTSSNARRFLGCVFEVTARCNNNCRHCYINIPPSDRNAESREISAKDICNIADQAISMGAVFSTISGGEPLLRDDFRDIYLGLKQRGLLLTIMTNATLVTEDHVSLFQKYPPRNIEVTVYGLTESTYESVTRRPGSFGAFMRGLNLLLDSGINIRLKAMVLRSNMHEFKSIAEFCRARTKDWFRFDPWLHLRYDADPLRNEEIKSERLSVEDFIAVEMGDSERRDGLASKCDRMIVDKEHAVPYRSRPLFNCGAGNGGCTVSYEGFFQLCSSLQYPESRCDLKKVSLSEAYGNLVPKVRAMSSHRAEFLDKCGRCPIVNFCLWCPAHAYLETGNLDTPVDYFCEVAHARAKMFGVTLENIHMPARQAVSRADQASDICNS